MFFHYPDDAAARAISYQQFLLGDNVLVAPVLDPGVDTVRVYFPAASQWRHLWSDVAYPTDHCERVLRQHVQTVGCYENVPAPIGRPAVFYRAVTTIDQAYGAQLREHLSRANVLAPPRAP